MLCIRMSGSKTIYACGENGRFYKKLLGIAQQGAAASAALCTCVRAMCYG